MYSVSFRALTAAGICVASLLPLAGCDPKTAANNGLIVRNNELLVAPEGTISIYEFAGRLRMRVLRSSSTWASLTAGRVTVAVFADPAGCVFVNGRKVGPEGGITAVGDTIFVPADAVETVRLAALNAEYAERPRPEPQPQPSRPPNPPDGLVVLDPGHGGDDPGAPGATGTPEKTINLSVTTMAAEILRARGVRVVMTRSDDRFIELNERAAIANRNRADLFVSIHSDGAENPSAQGFTIYVSRSASSESLRAAEMMHRRMARRVSQSRGMRRADFRVLVRTTCPAVLVELGFQSNRQEAALLAHRPYQQRLAEAIADGVIDFLRR